MSRSNKKPLIGITLGDPTGIGPEITAKALRHLPKNLADYIVIGDASAFKPGKPSAASAKTALHSLNHAIELLKNKKIDGLVTAPLSKEHITKLGIHFEGHTEYLAKAFHVKQFGMMFVGPEIRTVIVTRHVALTKVPQTLSVKNISETIQVTNKTLQKLFKIKKPTLAACGLNPHAGEGGTMGKEEIAKIIPALKKARKQGIRILGPFAADTLFAMGRYKKFDAIVAMYHDQGLIPVKTLFFDKLVNLTIGLPFIRTSPAHGTAFDIAGKNKADHHSMMEAIRLAAQLSRS